ncbi:MAG: cob(I)yrinic acid a,c-diamide adenosyltransferase [Fidelibacterota bacterium]
MGKKEKQTGITINKVYTRTGDQGTTRLVGGQVRKKSNTRIQAYGTVDELNSVIGGCVEMLRKEQKAELRWKELTDILIRIQHELFNLGTMIATLPEDITPKIPQVSEQDIRKLENAIDDFNRDLPTLHSFVLPGGSEANVWFHLARTVCRRAERICVELMQTEQVDIIVIQYLNRLSDALFVWSRFVTTAQNCKERLWKPIDKSTD